MRQAISDVATQPFVERGFNQQPTSPTPYL
jgi:hypothetical protein